MKTLNAPSSKAYVVRGAFYMFLLLSAFVIRLALGQQNATDSAIDPTKSSFAVGHATSGSAEAQPSPVAAATAVVVWDQYNNAGTAVTLSATFTDASAMNSDLADDFVVQGYAWMVRWSAVHDPYFNGPGPANTFTVTFYSDNDGFPGNQVYASLAWWEQTGSTFRIHVCDNPPCQPVLYPARYWVEIQANMTAKCCGEWGWTDRTVTDLNAAVWRNPSGFFGACTSWSRRGATCGLDPSAPDQVYRIYANVIPVCSIDSGNLGCGGTINFQPTEFSIDMGSCPVDPATVHTSSFTVNNIQPDSFTLLNNNTTIRFHYNTTPVVPGLNTMHVPAGGFNCVCGPVLEFTCTFTYQASTPTPTPTPTPTATATPTATTTPAASPSASEAQCTVIGSQPTCDSTISTQVTDFVVSIGAPVEPSSVQPSDFTVNGTPADDDGVAGTGITFHFNASPVVQGQNTMHIPAGAFICEGSGHPVDAFTCAFTYQPSTPTPTQPPPSPTATATPTATPTLTPRPSPTPRVAPPPRVHP